MKREDYVVKARVLVRGPDRDSTGHSFYFCAGRGWSKNWTQVNVVKGDANPVEEYLLSDKSGEKGTRVIMDMITEAQLAELRADDGNIVVRDIKEGTGEAKDLDVDVTALMGKNAAQAAEIVKLKGENEHLKTQLRETEALLEQATTPAQELMKKVGNRRGG